MLSAKAINRNTPGAGLFTHWCDCSGNLAERIQESRVFARYCQESRKETGCRNTSAQKYKRGYRAEVRRERKKRDILSPVNVLD